MNEKDFQKEFRGRVVTWTHTKSESEAAASCYALAKQMAIEFGMGIGTMINTERWDEAEAKSRVPELFEMWQKSEQTPAKQFIDKVNEREPGTFPSMSEDIQNSSASNLPPGFKED